MIKLCDLLKDLYEVDYKVTTDKVVWYMPYLDSSSCTIYIYPNICLMIDQIDKTLKIDRLSLVIKSGEVIPSFALLRNENDSYPCDKNGNIGYLKWVNILTKDIS